jgi:hypothetical protein
MHSHIAEPQSRGSQETFRERRSSTGRWVTASLLTVGAVLWALPSIAGPGGSEAVRHAVRRSLGQAVDVSPVGRHAVDPQGTRAELEAIERTAESQAQATIESAQEAGSQAGNTESDRVEFDAGATALGLYAKTNQDGELDFGCVPDGEGNCTVGHGRPRGFVEVRIEAAGEKRTIRVGHE